MQQLSDNIGRNQFASITYECADCGEEHIATIKRISDIELDIDNAIIGVKKFKTDFTDRYVFKCPDCYEKDNNFGLECDIYSRVVGFYRPIKYWNKGKRAEYKERVVYDMPKES